MMTAPRRGTSATIISENACIVSATTTSQIGLNGDATILLMSMPILLVLGSGLGRSETRMSTGVLVAVQEELLIALICACQIVKKGAIS